MYSYLLDKIGDWNPQLLRELKGRLKPRNILAVAFVSIFCQWCFYSLFHRRQDLFITTSMIAIFVLLVGGTYLIIADLAREESRGTLNFIRLSPQSAQSILTGKILGVPILLYLLVILALPLNLSVAIAANIPFLLVIGFYGIIISSCAFFYSGALFSVLTSSTLVKTQASVCSAAVLFFLWLMSIVTTHDYFYHFGNVLDWLTLFYPAKALFYLVASIGRGESLNLEPIAQLSWFNLNLGQNSFMGILFIILNYGIWTYFFGEGIKRRFHNSMATPISKQQSYWLTASLTILMLGFSLQNFANLNPTQLFINIVLLLCLELVLFLSAIAALSPHGKTLQDWARHRHQARDKNQRNNLLQDLIFGEKSPATLAIAINLAIASLILLPCLLILPLQEYKFAVLMGVILNLSIILIYASFTQLMLTMKTSKRKTWAIGSVMGLIILPLLVFVWLSAEFNYHGAEVFLYSLLPILAIKFVNLGALVTAFIFQWAAILFLAFLTSLKLKALGASDTKALLDGSN